MKRFLKGAQTWAGDAWRNAGPSLVMMFALFVAYAIGRGEASAWLILLSAVLGGWAIGMAADRAETRAASEWAGKFWRLIETDHVLEISVTHHNATRSTVSVDTER